MDTSRVARGAAARRRVAAGSLARGGTGGIRSLTILASVWPSTGIDAARAAGGIYLWSAAGAEWWTKNDSAVC